MRGPITPVNKRSKLEAPDCTFTLALLYPLRRAEAMIEAFGEYLALTDRLVALWRYPLLTLTARPRSYQERTRALIEWLEGYQVGHGLAAVGEIPTQHK
jgi:hypothetical protein